MKRIALVMLMAPIAACVTEDEDELKVEVTGILQSSDVTIYSGVANAGLMAGTESQQTFNEAISAKQEADDAIDPQPLSIKASRKLIVSPQPCEQSGTVSVDLTEDTVTVDFEACTGALGGSLDGEIAYKGENVTIEQNLFSISASVEYFELRAQSLVPEIYAELDGKVTAEFTITNMDWHYGLTSSSFDYSDSSHDFLLNNFKFELSGEHRNDEQVPASWTYDYHVTTKDGTFYVKSDGPITLVDSESEKRNGTILVEGVNAILTITLNGDASIETEEVMFSLDMNKNGSEDVTVSMSQAAFYGWD